MIFHKKMTLSGENSQLRSQTKICLFSFLVMLLMSISITGCSGGDAPPPTPVAGDGTPVSEAANTIALSLSQNSVKSDSSDTTTITATAIKNNIPQQEVTIDFSTTAGLISTGSEITDSNGEAIITFRANPGNRANQIATLTATSDGISKSIPITIAGTAITLTADKTSLKTAETATLKIEVKDAGGSDIHDATVALSSSNGNVSLSATTGTTVAGTELKVIVSGATVGSTDITVTSLGATKTMTFVVIPASTAIEITDPATSPVIIQTNTGQTVTVTGPDGTVVRFVTSLGSWGNGQPTQEATISGGSASATLTSVAVGTATVQVSAIGDPSKTDTTFINVSPPITDASQVALTFSSTTIPPSSDSITHSVTIYAKVITATSEPVANVPVTFNLSNTTGGGEYVNPPQALTDSSGYATTTFYSGTSSSSGLGVNVTATEMGSLAANSDTASIIIGGIAASITLTPSTKISSSSDNTYYTLPMSVIVSDSSGAAVENAIVALSAWPTRYRLGYNDDGAFILQLVPAGPYAGQTSVPNEDADRDLILDAGEDVGPCNELTNCTDFAADGVLTPASAAGGTVPSTITTIANGTGSFELTYLKNSALWVESEVTATVRVMGTESKTSLTFWLRYLLGEEVSLFSSPYGYY
jgi:hypothetical protein